eukprot:PhM_4_TR17903/c0_g1_i1/m.64804
MSATPPSCRPRALTTSCPSSARAASLRSGTGSVIPTTTLMVRRWVAPTLTMPRMRTCRAATTTAARIATITTTIGTARTKKRGRGEDTTLNNQPSSSTTHHHAQQQPSSVGAGRRTPRPPSRAPVEYDSLLRSVHTRVVEYRTKAMEGKMPLTEFQEKMKGLESEVAKLQAELKSKLGGK